LVAGITKEPVTWPLALGGMADRRISSPVWSACGYATIAAVETFVDRHYQQQIDHLREFGGPEGLLPLLIRCQADEQHHRDESAALAGKSLGVLTMAWCWTVGRGSLAAVVLARRI
jgi:ubiquinone biosynthesis monooxygenase Coq7